MPFAIKRNDLSPNYPQQLLSNGVGSAPIDLTGCTVWLIMTLAGASEPTLQKQAVVDDATTGRVHYEWDAGDTAAAGLYKAEWEILYPDGKPRTWPERGYEYVQIDADLGSAGVVLPPSPGAAIVTLGNSPTEDGQIPRSVLVDGKWTAQWTTFQTNDIISRARGGFGEDISAKTGIPLLANGSVSYIAPPAGALVGTSETQTLSHKGIDASCSVDTAALVGSISTASLVGSISTAALVGSIALGSISGLGSGVSAFLATPSSANLKAALTDETGSGAAVFATSPTLVTPVLGAATGTSLTTTGAIASNNGTDIKTILQPCVGLTTTHGAVYILAPATSPSGTNPAIVGNDTNVYINAPSSSGSVFLTRGLNTGLATFASNLTSLVNPVTITKSGIGTTSTDGTSWVNSTASTSGTPVQYSTRLRQSGTAYSSTSTLSETHDYAQEVRPVSVAGATTSSLVFMRSLNGGAYADLMKIMSTGGYQLPTAISTPANPPAGSVVVWFDGTNLKAKNSSGSAVTWA